MCRCSGASGARPATNGVLQVKADREELEASAESIKKMQEETQKMAGKK